jgi:hypothetical protein
VIDPEPQSVFDMDVWHLCSCYAKNSIFAKVLKCHFRNLGPEKPCSYCDYVSRFTENNTTYFSHGYWGGK